MLRKDNDAKVTLKQLYKDYFKMGVSVEPYSDQGLRQKNEIGNPEKEALILKEFNTVTFGNDLKPLYNMGFQSPEATEEYIPFVPCDNAKYLLSWVKKNNMSMRGHVLVWHSQCPKEVFCKNYEPITYPTDPKALKERPMLKVFEKLKPECYVDRDTLLKRLKSYIYSLMEYMYKNEYANHIYAWDVVNEAIELGESPNGLRNSYWYQIIGEDFVYWAFRFARDAVNEYSVKYASLYSIDPTDLKALKTIQPSLFYNDYNEDNKEKKDAIIALLNRETEDHGSIISEGLIDGIGLQCHVSDNINIDEYMNALKEYASIVDEIHITEMDVKCTCRNNNGKYYQAVFYQQFFEALLKAKREGANVTSLTIWGLTDNNSWIRENDPVLFNGDLSKKLAYDGIVYAVTGEGSLGEPARVICNLTNRYHDFETPEDSELPMKTEEPWFRVRGFGKYEIQSEVVFQGKAALARKHRFQRWNSVGYDITDFIGQTIEITAWCKSEAEYVCVSMDNGKEYRWLGSTMTKFGEWSFLDVKLKVPNNTFSCDLIFDTWVTEDEKVYDFYLDNVQIKLIGLEESFEEETNIASVKVGGHLPFCKVVDTESRQEKGHSYYVTRLEKDAVMEFIVSFYNGRIVDVTAYVKTTDQIVRLVLNGVVPEILAEEKVQEGEWTKVSARLRIPDELRDAEFYIETDGVADYYVDDISVIVVD